MKKLAFILICGLFVCCSVRPVEGSDSWYVQEISKEHPDWSYDRVEDSRFLPDSLYFVKYDEK